MDRAVQRREYLAVCFAAEDGEWKPWTFEGWRRCFGTLSEPNFPWGFVKVDNCQFAGAVGREGPLAEKSCFWLSDFSLSAAGLRCGKPDALGNVPHDHGKKKVTNYNLQGAAICAALPDIGLRIVRRKVLGASPAPPQPVPEMPRNWDSVRANLEVYALAGEKVSEDPRRTEAYRDLVWEGLKIEAGPTRPGLTARISQPSRKSCGVRLRASGRKALPGLRSGSLPTTVSLQVREEVQRGQLVRGTFRLGLGSVPYEGDAEPQAGAKAPLGSGLSPR